jgi:hypothetical protein
MVFIVLGLSAGCIINRISSACSNAHTNLLRYSTCTKFRRSAYPGLAPLPYARHYKPLLGLHFGYPGMHTKFYVLVLPEGQVHTFQKLRIGK